MLALNDLTIEKMQIQLADLGLKPYRVEQIFRWTASGADDWEQMSNVPLTLREKLSLQFLLRSVKIITKRQSRLDSTRKYLMQMHDGALVESVLMEYKHGFSACISTQVGCRMGCAFCASAQGGLERNLTPAEMLGQIVAMQNDADVRISNIVLMGMGEPLDNYANVLDFLHIINNHMGLNIGLRHISVSTCGLADKIRSLADEGVPICLSVSLHASTDEVRQRIMPVAKRFSLNEVLSACRFFSGKTGRRISFEYILIDGLNDSNDDAKRLARLVAGMPSHVNLIPANPCGDGKFSASNRVLEFRDRLMKLGVNTTIRRTLGSDISASCGQLRRQSLPSQPDIIA
ncbi:MAG: 23S rRNA (adenine(2503)-C(2))-methyltransferase RlmN [Clostridiales bacterium]|jgi:23S rRNA (adenine2503-C2)-methyltransferase|nr:23S rRNA (adenine(2503)-C(2))-methyltransferase RlmN [Clostridiales bacterium]